MEKAVKRIINDPHDPHQQHQLDDQWDQTGKRVVFFCLVQLGLFFGNRIRITEIACLNPVECRLHFHHFDGIFLHPNR